MVYLERRANQYAWRLVPAGAGASVAFGGVLNRPTPDAWLAYGGRWPSALDEGWEDFAQDLLAELDSMVDGADRCRWPLDAPWSHRH